MAANPLIACDLTTSWYNFTYSLSWSSKCEVAEVLSDIPFICVGILVFGVSALFLVVKRVTLSAVWLLCSALLAFAAAVLDLGQTLANGMAVNTTFIASEPVIRAREVLFALSIGFRFLFYWSYVAEPPRKDLSATSTQTAQKIKFLVLERTYGHHSGSWTRWGFPGKLLRIGLLVAIITITALQIVWRVAPQFHQYGDVYGTDAALELLVSFFLLVKLLLNTLTLNSPNNMLVHTFRECLAPISGILVNITIGVGSLLSFAFTESTVGRLLQAFEVYIIVVFAVVTAFLRYRDILLSTSLQDRERRDVVLTLPEPARGSTFRITLPFIETPRISTILGSAIQTKESSREALRRSAHRSLNHVSSWVSSRVSRNRARYEDDEVRLWNAEKVKVDPPYTGNTDRGLARGSASLTQGSKELAEPLREVSANDISISSAQPAILRPMDSEGFEYGGQISRPSRTDVPQRPTPPQDQTSPATVSSVRSPTSSGVNCAGNMTATAEASPVYGLSGIQSFPSVSNSRTSLDELLRQQNQLDQSIKALKLFSARTSANSSHSNSTTSPRSMELTRSPSTGQRTVSSEVSLSSFPIPPWLTTPVPSLPSSNPSSIKRTRGNRLARLAAARPTPVQDTFSSVSPMLSATSLVDIQSPLRLNSIPRSPLGEENESLSAEAGMFSRSDSAGTQYNVTSFIGGLATPGEPRLGSQEKPWWPTESDSNVKAIQTSSGMKELSVCMQPRFEGLLASRSLAKLLPPARSSRSFQGDVVNEPAIAQYQASDCAHTPVTDHAAKGVAILPTRLQFARETISTERANRGQRKFVRPRPPPIAIQSYTEQNPGISLVEVLADN